VSADGVDNVQVRNVYPVVWVCRTRVWPDCVILLVV